MAILLLGLVVYGIASDSPPSNSGNQRMWATNIIGCIISLVFWPVQLIALPATMVGNTLLAIPVLNIALIVIISLAWLPFLGILLATSWLWYRSPRILHPMLAMVGVPAAVIGNSALVLSPSGPNAEDQYSKKVKQSICQAWPYADPSTSGEPILEALRREYPDQGYFSLVYDYARVRTNQNLTSS